MIKMTHHPARSNLSFPCNPLQLGYLDRSKNAMRLQNLDYLGYGIKSDRIRRCHQSWYQIFHQE